MKKWIKTILRRLLAGLADPAPELSEDHSATRCAPEGEAPPVAYGRPQHIPETVKARMRAEWNQVGDLEPVDEAARP